MSRAFMLACSLGATVISVSIMDGVSLPAMKMATAFVKCISIPWRGSGLSCGAGCVRIGVYHKRNSRSTWGSSSSCTTSASAAKRCCQRSLSYSSQKTLESNKSVICYASSEG